MRYHACDIGIGTSYCSVKNTDLGRHARCAECNAPSRLQYCRARAYVLRAALYHSKGSKSVNARMFPLRLAHCWPQCPIAYSVEHLLPCLGGDVNQALLVLEGLLQDPGDGDKVDAAPCAVILRA